MNRGNRLTEVVQSSARTHRPPMPRIPESDASDPIQPGLAVIRFFLSAIWVKLMEPISFYNSLGASLHG